MMCTLYILWCICQAKATLNKIKPLALAVIELHLSEGIRQAGRQAASQSVSQSVENSIKQKYF